VSVAFDASARTWHVALDRSGDAPTIQAAVDSARSGDEVVLAPATYTWTNQDTQSSKYNSMVVIQKRIVLRGPGADSVTLDGERQGRVVWCDSCTVAGVTVTGGETYNGTAGAGVWLSVGARLVDCVVRGNRVGPIGGGGGVVAWYSSVIEDCLIE
jgi:hypothetical protein